MVDTRRRKVVRRFNDAANRLTLSRRSTCASRWLHSGRLCLDCYWRIGLSRSALGVWNGSARIGAVVHLRTRVPAHTSIPINWIAVGDPAEMFPPDQHDAIWRIQKPLNFSKFVYGVERAPDGQSNMREITQRRSGALHSHMDDTVVNE